MKHGVLADRLDKGLDPLTGKTPAAIDEKIREQQDKLPKPKIREGVKDTQSR